MRFYLSIKFLIFDIVDFINILDCVDKLNDNVWIKFIVFKEN